jgi:4-alpha-glucanotransferase
MSPSLRDAIALRRLAQEMGVATKYKDGLHRRVVVGPETIVRVCAALGAPIARPEEAADALVAVRESRHEGVLPPVLVAWDGQLRPLTIPLAGEFRADLHLEQGGEAELAFHGGLLTIRHRLPMGYHELTIEQGGQRHRATVIAAPVESWRHPGFTRSWGVGTHLAALRSGRSRSLGDLHDLETVCHWIHDRGGNLVTVLPLLPTFNSQWPEPSPYSPVSRLFWSELILDLGAAHQPTDPPATLDVSRADAEVRQALHGWPLPSSAEIHGEMAPYARFRGAQARLGRNWRDWPAAARDGRLEADQVDQDEQHFQLVAQSLVTRQLHDLRQRLNGTGMRLGLDLAVGCHPDGYDTWSRQGLFSDGMSVGAPPDGGFPSGQDWGFSPVAPTASRREGHRYLAAAIAHQASAAGVLRIDHIMAWTRLYWIPHGMGLHQGTYVSYPAEELFAVLTLESHRHQCEIVGENLGTVPKDIFEALPRHRIWGMYLAMFAASDGPAVPAPTAADMALIGTHDTPTFAGWIAGDDITDRVKYRLLKPEEEAEVRAERARAVTWLAEYLGADVEDQAAFFAAILEWLGRTESPLLVPWLEDLWLEPVAVNLPGTASSVRPNWQRPMRRLLDEIIGNPQVEAQLRLLHRARNQDPATASPSHS